MTSSVASLDTGGGGVGLSRSESIAVFGSNSRIWAAAGTGVNHDSVCAAGNEPAMTRVDFAPDRIDCTTKCGVVAESSEILGVAGREVHGYSDPPRPTVVSATDHAETWVSG